MTERIGIVGRGDDVKYLVVLDPEFDDIYPIQIVAEADGYEDRLVGLTPRQALRLIGLLSKALRTLDA